MKRRVRDRTKFQVNLNIFKFLSIILIIVFISFIPAFIQKLIKIDKIECESQFGDCDAVLINSINIRGNYRDVKKIIEQRLSENVRINSYLIQYKIPSTINIELNLTKPKFAIKGQGEKIFLIDKNGIVLEVTSESNLPTLVSNVSYKVGENITAQDSFALKIIEKVGFTNSIKEGISDSKELKITLNEGVIVHFPLEGDVDVLVGSLRLIFSRLNAEANGIRMVDVHEIDLRFKNPVIR